MKHFIVTGSSKGLGEAIVKKLIKKNHYLHCISRTSNSSLVDQAKEMNVLLKEYPFDLSDVQGIEELMDTVFSNIQLEGLENITLINNAGVIHPIKQIEKSDTAEIVTNIQVNLLAPMILSKSFIHHTETLNINKTILNISSGAGKRPIPSWSIYCSSKAGLDLFSRTIAEEQKQKATDYSVKILSVAPGVVDTNMQDQIRSASVKDFTSVEQFRKFKEEGSLFSPEMIAEKLLGVIADDTIENGSVLDIRQFL